MGFEGAPVAYSWLLLYPTILATGSCCIVHVSMDTQPPARVCMSNGKAMGICARARVCVCQGARSGNPPAAAVLFSMDRTYSRVCGIQYCDQGWIETD